MAYGAPHCAYIQYSFIELIKKLKLKSSQPKNNKIDYGKDVTLELIVNT